MIKKKNFLKISTLALIMGLATVSEGYAQASATVRLIPLQKLEGCQLVVHDVDWAQLNPDSPPPEVVRQVEVKCPLNILYKISMGQGQSFDYNDRVMREAGNTTLQYQLYTDTGGVWGTQPVLGKGTGLDSPPQYFSIHGKILGLPLVGLQYLDIIICGAGTPIRNVHILS